MGEVRASARLRNFLDVGLAERGQGSTADIPTSVRDCRTLAPRPESPNLPLLKLKSGRKPE